MYCCSVAVHTLLMKIINGLPADAAPRSKNLKASVIVDETLLAVLFDWLMEPRGEIELLDMERQRNNSHFICLLVFGRVFCCYWFFILANLKSKTNSL